MVRGITREDGLELGTPSRTDFATTVRQMAGNEPEPMARIPRGLEPLLAVPASMIEQLARLTKRVLDIVEHEETCRQPMTTPRRGLLTAFPSGIGSKASWPSMASARSHVGLRAPHGAARALTFRATIDQSERFTRPRDVGAHLGLTP